MQGWGKLLKRRSRIHRTLALALLLTHVPAEETFKWIQRKVHWKCHLWTRWVTSWTTRGCAFSRAHRAVHAFATAAMSTQTFSILLPHLFGDIITTCTSYRLAEIQRKVKLGDIFMMKQSVPSSAAHSGRWKWTFPEGSWRWWTGRPWRSCFHWHTSVQRPRSGPADTARRWPQSPTI